MKNADLPAMPIEFNGFGQYAPECYGGLTKREMFAMAAMQGLTSIDNFSNDSETISNMAKWSVKCADALLAALDNKEAI